MPVVPQRLFLAGNRKASETQAVSGIQLADTNKQVIATV